MTPHVATGTAALILVATTIVAAGEKHPLRVYVHTRIDVSGFVDADQKRRQDSVRDIKSIIDRDTKRFQPVAVESITEADIVVEVLSSSKEDTGDRTGWNPLTGFAGANKVERKPIVRARVTVADYSTEIANLPIGGSWRIAADHWQREFRKWVNANSDRLLAARRTP
jgi:hypothetical protein